MTAEKCKWLPRYTTMYFISLALLVASLPLSKFTMSLFQFSTLFFWLWHGVDETFLEKYAQKALYNPILLIKFIADVVKAGFIALIRKFREFFKNKPALAIASIMLLHVIGLVYTSDFEYALKDLRTKLPIFILPLFIATGPRISTRTFYWILAALVAATLGGSIYRLILFENMPIADSRSISAHTSHIRFCLNAVYAVFILFFFVGSKEIIKTGYKVVLLLVAFWLIAFMFYMNYTTGMMLIASLLFLCLLFFALRIKTAFLRTTVLLTIIGICILPVLYLISVSSSYMNKPVVEFPKLEKLTSQGNYYYHDTVNFKSRNGNWIGLYICDKELRQSWSQRSQLPLDSLDKNSQYLRYTLISYLASKNLRKDADGMSKLSQADIRNIENGINRSDFEKLPGIRSQIEDFITGYQHYINKNDPNSGSMVQRLEYWRSSLLIVMKHPIIGVGTGDIPDAFENQYQEMNSKLSQQNRLRSHNQYLSITVGFGILGFLWFMFAMFYPGIITRNFNNYFYVIFWIIFMVSMLTEDTIESQEGVTFYVLLTALMLLGREKTEKTERLFD